VSIYTQGISHSHTPSCVTLRLTLDVIVSRVNKGHSVCVRVCVGACVRGVCVCVCVCACVHGACVCMVRVCVGVRVCMGACMRGACVCVHMCVCVCESEVVLQHLLISQLSLSTPWSVV